MVWHAFGEREVNCYCRQVFPRVHRPADEPAEEGAEMAWFWATKHDSPEGSWQLRIVRPGIVPATPLTADPGVHASSAQTEHADPSPIHSEGSPTLHDEL